MALLTAADYPAPGLAWHNPALQVAPQLQSGGQQAASLPTVETGGQALQGPHWLLGLSAAQTPAPPLSLVEVAVGGPLLALLALAGEGTLHLEVLHVGTVQSLPPGRQSGQHTASHRVKSQGEPGLGHGV